MQAGTGKKEQVRMMFDGIARHYDFLNRFLSLGIDRSWRRKAIDQLKPLKPATVLDMATGTGELALEALRLHPESITGIDLSDAMLDIGRRKVKERSVEHIIRLEKGDSECTGLPAGSFDAVTVAFGVRNFENLAAGLSEMVRLLKHGGMAVILEFSNPEKFPVRQLFHFYFHKILPFFGRIVSRDAEAYSYLPRSVSVFPQGQAFTELMREAGLSDTKCIPLTFGIATIYTGYKQ